MSEKFGNFFPAKVMPKGFTPVPTVVKPSSTSKQTSPLKSPFGRPGASINPALRKPVYTKVFHWRLPKNYPTRPKTVEVVGSFTNWKPVAMNQNGDPNAWDLTLRDVPSHRTHRYMILVDGQPSNDGNVDGLAIPQGPDEVRYQIATDRGPRVFMLFAQTK